MARRPPSGWQMLNLTPEDEHGLVADGQAPGKCSFCTFHFIDGMARTAMQAIDRHAL